MVKVFFQWSVWVGGSFLCPPLFPGLVFRFPSFAFPPYFSFLALERIFVLHLPLLTFFHGLFLFFFRAFVKTVLSPLVPGGGSTWSVFGLFVRSDPPCAFSLFWFSFFSGLFPAVFFFRFPPDVTPKLGALTPPLFPRAPPFLFFWLPSGWLLVFFFLRSVFPSAVKAGVLS